MLGAVPFTFVLVGVAWCWIKALREETRDPDRDGRPADGRGDTVKHAGGGGPCSGRARGLQRGDERDASPQPQGASLRVTIGTQEFPEARILGELWREALAVNGYAVNLRKGVGPAEELDEALKDGDVDGYVAYTGTVLSIVAGEDVSGLDPGGDLRAGEGVLRRPGHGDGAR